MAKTITGKQVGDSYYQVEHPSGLTVLLYPKEHCSTTYAIFGTRYGSIDNCFQRSDEAGPESVPEGIAHYLEHKLFESEEGDAFERFSKTGASANAFTSFESTCYLFSTTDQVYQSLEILLDFVQSPYFTEETVRKEQGIIGQEIKMYDDSPDWRLLTGLFRCLYRSHPIRDDIAGTVESIARLTPELLYACTEAFYRPANMVLSVAGDITLDQAVAACRRAGLDVPPARHTIEPALFAPENDPPQKELRFSMPVNKPCFALGYREQPVARGDLRRELLAELLPDLVCGGLTDLYRKLYDEALVNPEFSGDAACLVDGACVIAFTGESEAPRAVADMVRAEIARLRAQGVDPELFTLVKNQLYGEMLSNLEDVDGTAESMAMAHLRGHTLAQSLDALAALTVADADQALQTMLREENAAYVEIRPQQDAPAAQER